MTRTVLTQDVQDVVLAFMEGLDCPRALTVAILLRSSEWDQLTSLEADPKHYSSPLAYLDAVTATDLLRKYRGFDLDVDPEAAALEKWWWAEKECFRTNRRLDTYLHRGPFGGPTGDPRIASIIDAIRKNVIHLIGASPPETFPGFFGPGATVSDTSRLSTIPDKMSSTPTFTPNALFHLVPWTGTMWASASAGLGRRPSEVRGNIYFTVNKTSRTKRSCAKEPSINGFYQLGLGRIMRKRLLSRGIDLVNGQTVHRRVACAASRSGEFATLDMTSASDCKSTALVELCLPPKWHQALSSLRSPCTRVQGRWVKLEKFSSMGNGFTFELETVIFTAICMALVPSPTIGENIWVYGDDIIVPTESACDVMAALKFFGFTPNERKTFSTGPFRESCGGDFFDGVPVRPVHLEEDPDEPQKLISFANSIRRVALNNGHPDLRWHALRRSWFRCLDLLPAPIRRCRGPEALGDIVLHDDEKRWDTRWRANSVRYVRVYRPCTYRKVMWEGFAYDVQMATAVYGVRLDQRPLGQATLDKERYLVPRDGVLSYKVGWVPFS